MPRFVARAGYWSGIAFLALAVAALGLGWASWRRKSDDVTLAAAAYANNDFIRAAELARRRLKMAPQDTEALTAAGALDSAAGSRCLCQCPLRPVGVVPLAG